MTESPTGLEAPQGDVALAFLQPPLEAVGLEDFLARKFPPREMLLAPWLPLKGLALVFSPRGVGKTHFAIAVAYAVATGGEFLGWSAPAPRRVLLVDGEMPAAALQARLAEVVSNSPLPRPSHDYLQVLASDLCEMGVPDLSTHTGQEQFEKVIGSADLIIIDNLSTVCRSGKENEAESWASVQAWALAQRRKGRSVLFVHHAGKAGQQRGTSKREDVMDTVVKLSHPEDYDPADGARFRVAFTKSRGFLGADAEPFEATLREGKWQTAAIVDERGARAQQLEREGRSQRSIAKELGCSVTTVNRLLRRTDVVNADAGAGCYRSPEPDAPSVREPELPRYAVAPGLNRT